MSPSWGCFLSPQKSMEPALGVWIYTHLFPICDLTLKMLSFVPTPKTLFVVGSQVQARKGEGPLVQSFLFGGPIPGLFPPRTALYCLHSSSFQPHLPPCQLKIFMCSPFWALLSRSWFGSWRFLSLNCKLSKAVSKVLTEICPPSRHFEAGTA